MVLLYQDYKTIVLVLGGGPGGIGVLMGPGSWDVVLMAACSVFRSSDRVVIRADCLSV